MPEAKKCTVGRLAVRFSVSWHLQLPEKTRIIMTEHQYVLSQTANVAERERLDLLEQLEDARSQRYMTALGIQKGWRCLEVGAGHGSIARWLAAQVGPQGRVVATDINPRFLTEMQLPNIEVRQHDIRTDPLEPGLYDLAHCRSVLVHMPEPQLVVRRMVAALRSGGGLLVEEGDASSVRAVDANHPLAGSFNRQSRELLDRLMHSTGYNPYSGCRVRGLLEDAGLTEIDNEGVSRIVRGGEAEARLMCMTLPAFVERGILSPAEYAEHQQVLLDPSFSFITRTTFAAWGKRAS
jgi:ubiquinone/menaquinone biosynthesis C-methylase UbiE